MLKQITTEFLDTFANHPTDQDINKAAQKLLNAFKEATQFERDKSLLELTTFLIGNDFKERNVLALVIGAIFEDGYDTSPVRDLLLNFFERQLISINKIFEFITEKAQTLEFDEEEEEPEVYELFERFYSEIEATFPDELKSLETLEKCWCCGIALLSVSKPARAEAQRFRELAEKCGELSNGGHWFRVILSVLDDEPFIAIDLDQMRGVRGKMSGVVENFQLQILLMDVFPAGWFGSGNPSRAIIENAKGLGEQCLDLTVHGRWNMYDWTGVQPDLKLPDHTNTGASYFWIWGEGKPEDIPVFNGYRVIILGKQSYQRTWRAQRMFAALPAELKIEEKLSKNEITELLIAMARTPRPELQIEKTTVFVDS